MVLADPPIAEWVAGHDGRHRAKPRSAPFSWRGDRFKVPDGPVAREAPLLYPTLPSHGLGAPGCDREARFFSSTKSFPVEPHFTFEQDNKAWSARARRVSRVGRPTTVPASVCATTVYSSGNERGIGTSPVRYAAAFTSRVRRIEAVEAAEDVPGPGYYHVKEPCEWQRHDLTIPGTEASRFEERPRPHSVFVDKRTRSRKAKQQEPGPGAYEPSMPPSLRSPRVITSCFRGPLPTGGTTAVYRAPPPHFR
jgi:hypothetical protein